MNRLILIGNGFDLAHGMKTSYADFIKWYVKSKLNDSQSSGKSSDELMTVEFTRGYPIIFKEQIDIWVEECFKKDFNLETIGDILYSYSLGGNIRPFTIELKSSLFTKLIECCRIDHWVDVEAIFYESLLNILKLDVNEERIELDKLNASMNTLRTLLQSYLTDLTEPDTISAYKNILNSPFVLSDFESGRDYRDLNKPHGDKNFPSKTLFVNFNYTNTSERYVDNLDQDDGTVNIMYIHGKLNDEFNPLIFGFGDELDYRYEQLERKNNKGYYKFIKSFDYLRTENYKDLVRFVDGEPYQVFIIGHSCGLSDRTMLHMMLEHINCCSIKIYYHIQDNKTNNYDEITYEIARHFKDKATLRKRVVSFAKSEEMPQNDTVH